MVTRAQQDPWKVAEGTDLLLAYEGHDLMIDLVPESGAVYLWRRTLLAPPKDVHSNDKFIKWLERTLQVPAGEVKETVVSHFLRLKHLAIQGRGLTKPTRATLQGFVETRENRVKLKKYVRDLAQFAPPLYCGQTDNLAQRVTDHLSASTGFGKKIREGKLEWSDLDLHFYVTDLGEEERRLLELITTDLSLSGYVSRRG